MQGLPITVRRSLELIGIYFLGVIIYVGQGIITPLLTAFFIAILLLPSYRFFRKRKLPETIAISFSLLMLVIILGLLIWFFSAQFSRLIEDFPQIKHNVMMHLNSLSGWINEKTNFSTERQLALINEQSNKLLNYAGGFLGGAAASLTSIFIFVGLLPIYIFLLLFYKNLLLRFVFMWFPENHHHKVEEVLRESEIIIKSYLIGLLIQISYITFLLGFSLMIIGIKHALLIGIIFAILNLIPYIGALIGNIIGVLLTLSSSEDLWPVFAVLITIAVVQFLDNNILMPRIVGSKVKINALASIVGVIVGGALAGISGMFLSLPLIAVLKIVFDRTHHLQQWGVLFGDEKPKYSPMSFPVFRKKSKGVQRELEKENKIEPTEKK
ncbi:AI-2E family transporter [Chitinophagaceae bacterium LB-8]|uniref:AI-2E family transporter n=1 Tax=Paraflavisolibacter caeni TaxID=2982496 RepID=A0A9X3BIR4_9BACT|nr:AI-2E family transporter [Paraflavisolibacter caeni]MCU7550328.1 AI-2E family transporter [Paraflavisolibacter caeni]